jgi:hypothetical protein
VTIVLISVGGLAFVAGVVELCVLVDTANSRRIQRRREAWKVAGNEGHCPGDDYGGHYVDSCGG